jgi:hypothetical protein
LIGSNVSTPNASSVTFAGFRSLPVTSGSGKVPFFVVDVLSSFLTVSVELPTAVSGFFFACCCSWNQGFKKISFVADIFEE